MRLRSWSKLEFLEPKGFLIGLAEVSEKIAESDLPYSVTSLRTNGLKRHREARQCALFCYGMSQLVGAEVRFAPAEESDVDFVAWFQKGEVSHFVPLQMKEVVPERVRANVSLQEELDKLSKYTDSEDLCVVFHVNRDIRVTPSELDLTRVKLRELWLVGCAGGDGQEWMICGDLLGGEAEELRFRYPCPGSKRAQS